jgi:hypothetical protein
VLLLRRVAGELVYMARSPGHTAAAPSPASGAAQATTWRRATPREAYICRACGFTEYYTLDLYSIPVDGDLVALLSAEPDGPYR